jgi:hypothetical protein
MAGAPQPIASTPPVAAPVAQPNGGAPAAAPAAPWYAEHVANDPELKGYAELKGWKSPAESIKAARDAEKLIGVPKDELLRLPKDLAAAKPEELDAIYTRLGRPATAADYKLPIVEGGEEFAGKMAAMLHASGVSQQQAATLATGWNAYIQSTVEATEREQAQREQVDVNQLHQEWPGEVFDQRKEMGRRYVETLVRPIAGDDTPEVLGKIEDAIGTAMFMKIFASGGEKLGEAPYVGDSTPGSRTMTPAAAHARIQELKGDAVWSKAWYNNPKGPEGQEFDRLSILASQRR